MKETLENKLDAGFKIYQDGDMFNVRELEVGMTLVYPKIVRGKIRCNLKGFPKCVTDKILFKREQYDGLKWQLHLKGMKAEYIFELFDTSENAFDSDKSLLIRTQLVKKGNKTVISKGVYNHGKEVYVKPLYLGFEAHNDSYILWINNDNPKKVKAHEQYAMVIKPVR